MPADAPAGAEWRNGEDPRIIAMTANAMQGDREARMAAGMEDDVTESNRVDQLFASLVQARPRTHASRTGA